MHCLSLSAYLMPGEVAMPLMGFRLDQLATLGLPLYVAPFTFPTRWASTGLNEMDEVGGWGRGAKGFCGDDDAHRARVITAYGASRHVWGPPRIALPWTSPPHGL